MSRSEDYLDQLLKGVSPEEDIAQEEEQDSSEADIFGDIFEELVGEDRRGEGDATDSKEEVIRDEEVSEEDIFGEDFSEEDIFGDDFLDEEFLREFELEMEKLEETEETGSDKDDLSLFDDLDGILNGAKEQMGDVEPVSEVMDVPEMIEEDKTEVAHEPETIAEPSGVETLDVMPEVDFADLFAGGDALENVQRQEDAETVSQMEDGFSFADLFADDSAGAKEETPQEDADVLKILEGLGDIDLELDEEDGSSSGENQGDFSALEELFAASEAGKQSELADDGNADSEANVEEAADLNGKKKKEKKKKESGEKTGFMNKLGLILFGEDDDEEEEEIKGKKKGTSSTGAGAMVIGEASEADLAMLEDITEKSKKEKKKKEKQEKKEKAKQEKQAKKEKAKKEKKPKPVKEKKPKKPKEPDNTPPLPKKPVFLIFLMIGSFIALVLIGADLLGYSNQMANAKNQYAKKNYSEAFAEISGVTVKEEDLELYNKYHVMAKVSVELEAYESLAANGFYDMALDCLIRTIGRAEKYRADAELYGCTKELNELEQKAEEILGETFDMSREDALEFYSYRTKKEYSNAILKVIKELGLEKVSE